MVEVLRGGSPASVRNASLQTGLTNAVARLHDSVRAFGSQFLRADIAPTALTISGKLRKLRQTKGS